MKAVSNLFAISVGTDEFLYGPVEPGIAVFNEENQRKTAHCGGWPSLNDSCVSENTGHEFQIWRRSLDEFTPLHFN